MTSEQEQQIIRAVVNTVRLRKLPNTELEVSQPCMGTTTFGKPADAAAACRMVDRCLEHGINSFDTANAWQGGVAETMLGEALRGRRHKTVIATKVWARMG